MNDIEKLERRYHDLALVFQTLASLNHQLWAAIREDRKFTIEESCGQKEIPSPQHPGSVLVVPDGSRKWVIEIPPKEQS